MDGKTWRKIRKDLTIVTSLVLLGLVGLSVLTSLGMDEAEGMLPLDDVHALSGCLMAVVAGLHALLHLGVMRTYATKRVRELSPDRPLAPADRDRSRQALATAPRDR